MVNIAKYELLLNMGLSLDHYFVMVSMYNKQSLPELKKLKGFRNLLIKKGLLKEDGTLTEHAIDIIQEDIVYYSSSTTTTTTIAPEERKDFGSWVNELHKKCQKKLTDLTGKKQVRGKIHMKEYPFMPGIQDFTKNLYKVIVTYKLDDWNVIEKCILGYIEKCNKAQNWFPTLYYYISKNNKSELVSDVENYDETETEDLGSNNIGDTYI